MTLSPADNTGRGGGHHTHQDHYIYPVLRIVSLLPAATEITARLGLLDAIVGVSHECDFPAEIRQRSTPIVTSSIILDGSPRDIDHSVRETLNAGISLYSLDEVLIDSLAPDVVLTQAT